MESNAEEAGPTPRRGLIRGRGMIAFPVERNVEEAGPTLRSGLIRGRGMIAFRWKETPKRRALRCEVG